MCRSLWVEGPRWGREFKMRPDDKEEPTLCRSSGTSVLHKAAACKGSETGIRQDK